MNDKYLSREQAGEVLASLLDELIKKSNLQKPYLLAIPRGGVQVAFPVAKKLNIPIHPFIVKKLPIPGNPETAFGAIAPDGTVVLDEETVKYLGLNDEIINKIAEKVREEINHRIKIYGCFKTEEIRSRDIIVVDDGIATGYSLIAALKSIKSMSPSSITLAVPVSAYDAYQKILPLVDNFVCPKIEKTPYFAVGFYYREWYDLSEEEIKNLLEKSKIAE